MEKSETLSDYELERGKPLPSFHHGIVQSALIHAFYEYSDKFIIVSELSLKLGDFSATPDISIYSKQPISWLHDQTKITEPPLMVVEIISPTQGMQEMIDKLENYFKNGVKSCWLVQTLLKSITLFTPDMKYNVYTSGEVQDPETGIVVSLDEIFTID
jgi:Uma2 family endonuclease